MKKKGSIQDMFFIGIVLLVFAIVTLIGFVVMTNIDSQLQTNDVTSANTDLTAASTTLKGHFTGIMDNIFLFLTVGLGIAAIVMAALVRVHPVFLVFFLIALVLMVFFAGIFSNIYQGMAESTQLAPYADQLTFISTILEFLPLIVGVFGTILMIVMYKVGQD